MKTDKVFSPKVDESLYSRQLYVIGGDAMKRMLKSHVLVVGLKNSGIEIVKNLSLAGIKGISMYDPSPVKEEDLSTVYYCSESDINDRIDKSIEYKIKGLNSNVSVKVLEAEPTDYSVYTAVLVNDQTVDYQIRKNEICRKMNIPFVAVRTKGLFFQIFCDFGDEFVTNDLNGESPYIGTVKAVSDTGIVTLLEDERHTLEDNDEILIRAKKYKITNTKAFSFAIEGYTGEPLAGETFEQIKQKKVVQFRSLRSSLEKPLIHSEIKGAETLHRCFLSYDQFKDMPFKEILEKFASEYPTEKEDFYLVREFFRQPESSICPVTSIAGGIAAHEILKACSGKFTPLQQFMYYHALESLPPKMYKKEPEKTVHPPSRYSPIYEIFGDDVVKIFKSGIFVVGAGAIGCEHLKNISMLGMGKDGTVALTDMDAIEKSNLNRQFLFREADISHMKSVVAAREASTLNPNPNNPMMAYVSKVGKETETLFNDEFYSKIDIILNGLDNVEARLYIDNRSVYHRVPVIDSGTLGSKGHTQTIIPNLTEHYGSTNDPQERSIPLCTIRNFPYLPVHCVEWGLADFKSTFTEQIIETKAYIKEASTEEPSESVSALLESRPVSYKDAFYQAVNMFIERFTLGPIRLCESFPSNHITEEGTPFWLPPKKMPSPVYLNWADPLHTLYVKASYCILCRIFGLEKVPYEEAFEEIGKSLGPFDKKIEKEDFTEKKSVDRGGLESIFLEEEEFEKDSEINSHVDYIVGAANIRSEVYGIQKLDGLEVKRIAGRIIPAIATTTAVVSGLAVIESIKYIFWGSESLEQYRNTFVSLALPLVMDSEPISPNKETVILGDKKIEITAWDTVEMADEPLSQIMEKIKEMWGVEVHTIMSDLTVLFCSFYNQKKFQENLSKKPSEILYPSGIPQGIQSMRIDAVVEDAEGNDLPVPFIKILFK